MKALKIGLAAAILVLAGVSVARADGADPTITLGGGHGSPPCVTNGTGYEAILPVGAFDIECDNAGATDITSFQFEILAAGAPGGVSAMLNGLLSPFPNAPELGPLNPGLLDWTASCVNGAVLDVCTASQSADAVGDVADFCSKVVHEELCGAVINASAAQLAEDFPKIFANAAAVCANPLVYVYLGVPPGCDLSAAGTAAAGDPSCPLPTSCDFVSGSAVGVTPVVEGVTPPNLPEPSSLSMLLIGLSGLPLLRRRFARSLRDGVSRR